MKRQKGNVKAKFYRCQVINEKSLAQLQSSNYFSQGGEEKLVKSAQKYLKTKARYNIFKQSIIVYVVFSLAYVVIFNYHKYLMREVVYSYFLPLNYVSWSHKSYTTNDEDLVLQCNLRRCTCACIGVVGKIMDNLFF